MPIGCAGNPVGNGTHDDKEEVHGKAHPDEHASALITPHLAHHVIDDVRHREDNDTCRQIDRPERELLCFQHVCRDQADAEQGAKKHKQHADFSFFLFHHSCFVKGGPADFRLSQVPLYYLNLDLNREPSCGTCCTCVYARCNPSNDYRHQAQETSRPEYVQKYASPQS